jgi:hypothetical protein
MLKNLKNKRIGKLKIGSIVKKFKNGRNQYLWECFCDCGNICYYTSQLLKEKRRSSCGCGKIQNQNLVGLKTGMLTVVDYAGIRNYDSTHSERRWKCLCSCGKYTNLSTAVLTKSKIKSCGCLHNLKGNKNKSWTGYEEISGSIWRRIKNSGKIRNSPFNITKEYIWKIFVNQNKKCKLSGRDLIMSKNASLDRIDSSKGYVKNNVQWVDKDVNRIKSDFKESYFIELCKDIAEQSKRRLEND